MVGSARKSHAQAPRCLLLTAWIVWAGACFVAGTYGPPAGAQSTEQTSTGAHITIPVNGNPEDPLPIGSDDEAQDRLLFQAAQMIKAGHPADALSGPIAQVIAHYENGPGQDRSQRHFCARGQLEAFMYMAEAAKAHQNANVLPQVWANAYFFESSALTNLGRLAESQRALGKALALSPHNSLYLAELGYTYEMQHDNEKALDLFQQAESATEFSLPDMKIAELAHALRGEGYALTELGRFDEAEAKYHEALKLDPNDEKSKNELQYIAQQRKKLDAAK